LSSTKLFLIFYFHERFLTLPIDPTIFPPTATPQCRPAHDRVPSGPVQKETLSHAGTADVEDLRCEMDAETENVVKVIFPDGVPGKC